ncbi:MAG: hypothetical protein RL069_1276 [Planctomycetota bacterium]
MMNDPLLSSLRTTLGVSLSLVGSISWGLAQEPVVAKASRFIPLPSVLGATNNNPSGAEATVKVVEPSARTIQPATAISFTPLPSLPRPKPPTLEAPGDASGEAPNATLKSPTRTIGSDAPLELLSMEGIKNLNKPVNPSEIFQRLDIRRVVKNPDSVSKLLDNKAVATTPMQAQDPRDYGLWGATSLPWNSPAFSHNPLYFEQVNLERYGIGYPRPLNALVSGSRFFIDATLLPVHMLQSPPHGCTSTLGYLRPGNCNPAYKTHP